MIGPSIDGVQVEKLLTITIDGSKSIDYSTQLRLFAALRFISIPKLIFT
jgi:hypothetical protein